MLHPVGYRVCEAISAALANLSGGVTSEILKKKKGVSECDISPKLEYT